MEFSHLEFAYQLMCFPLIAWAQLDFSKNPNRFIFLGAEYNVLRKLE